jgi:hypothetical protein
MNKQQNHLHIESSLPNIAFIVGMGRSGTTLLTSMLNMNPEIISTPENEFILFSYNPYVFKNFNNPNVVKSFIDIFNYNFNNVITIWKPKSIEKDVINLKIKSYANMCKLVYLNYPLSQKEKSVVKWVIDKNPSYSLHINKLNNVFPQAKYIVIVRDFRDNIVSRKKYSENFASIYSLAAAWNYFYYKIFKSIHKNNLSYHLVRYEDLVNFPKESLQEICNYLGVTFTDEMLRFQDFSKDLKAHAKENISDEKFKKISSMHSNLDNEVNSNRVEAYLDELSSSDISILDNVCSFYANKFNYSILENKNNKISYYKKFTYKLAYAQIVIFNFFKTMYYNVPSSLRLIFKQKSNKS